MNNRLSARLTMAAVAAMISAPGSAAADDGYGFGSPPPDRHCNAACRADLEQAAKASTKYHNPAVALAEGFVPVSPCEPGQGIHFLNPGRFNDDGLAVSEPEVLLYLPDAAGGLRLIGIEHVKRDADQDLTTTEDRPELYGQRFHGPMLGHDPAQSTPIHYELHVWLWSEHPDGIFVQRNPAVVCP